MDMSADVAPPTPLTLPPFTPGSDSDDDVNSSSAKVYFGPLLSPEKKLAPIYSRRQTLHPQNIQTPLRRSARLSTTPLRSLTEDDSPGEHVGDLNGNVEDLPVHSGEVTPVHSASWNDEPSSVLASRIMRAHDNPSPPPKDLRPPKAPFGPSRLSNELVFLPLNTSKNAPKPSNEPPVSDSEQDEDAIAAELQPQLMSALPSLAIWDTPPSPPSFSPSPPQFSDDDLIQFDKSIDMFSPTVNTPTPQLPTVTGETVDDLLFGTLSPLTPVNHECTPTPSTSQHCDQVAGSSSMTASDHSLFSTTPPRRRSSRLSVSPTRPIERLTPDATTNSSLPHLASPSVQIRKGDVKGKAKLMAEDNKNALLPHLRTEDEHCNVVEHSSSDLEQWSTARKRRDKKRMKFNHDEPSSEGQLHLAQSLSPDSTHLLTTLINPENMSTIQVDRDVKTDGEVLLPLKSKEITAVATGEKDCAATPIAFPELQRLPPESPFRLSPPHTPSQVSRANRSTPQSRTPAKMTLLPAGHDPARTPARRVLVSDSPHARIVKQRTPFARTPVFTRPATIDPTQSPARRIPVTEAMATGREVGAASRCSHVQTPSRSSANANADPATVQKQMARSPFLTVGKNGVFKPPTSSFTFHVATTTSPQKRSNPHLISSTSERNSMGGSEKHSRSSSPMSITEDEVPSEQLCTHAPKPSSSLLTSAKTMTYGPRNISSNDAGSRIPRIGPAKQTGYIAGHSSKLPMPSSRKIMPVNPRLTRRPSPTKSSARNKPSASASSGSDDSNLATTSTAPPDHGPSLVASKLKRKRTGEKSSSPPQPLIIVRQVVPGMFDGPVKSTTPSESLMAVQEQASPSPVRKLANIRQGPMRVREVVKGTLQDYEMKSASNSQLQALAEARAAELALRKKEQEEKRSEAGTSNSVKAKHADGGVLGLSKNRSSAEPPSSHDDDHEISYSQASGSTTAGPPQGIDGVLLEPQRSCSSRLEARRTTRPRQVSSETNDVFGAVSTISSADPVPSRRKGLNTGPTSALPTSALALKTLTNTNTVRNQQYHFSLETRIIRKEGDRPESPSMKLRTVLQKQREEQGKGRAERAKRRRGEDGSEAGDSTIDLGSSAVDAASEKHPRGPGDEEDYETPDRPGHSEKRVKWDRGLAATMCLDEVVIRPDGRHRVADGSHVSRKSCLANNSKKLLLDSLGNAADKMSSLELVPEKVVVTKFVYDNDDQPEIIVKQTRSRGKKAR